MVENQTDFVENLKNNAFNIPFSESADKGITSSIPVIIKLYPNNNYCTFSIIFASDPEV